MTPQEQNFQDYKKAETTALEIVQQMRASSPKKVDIELALLTAVFELHKGVLPPQTIGRIVQTHLETLVPFYEETLQQPES
jgi:response regulator RpfG family c-di-GMP phosphodiesterase